MTLVFHEALAWTWSTQRVDVTLRGVVRNPLPGATACFQVFGGEGTTITITPPEMPVPEGPGPVVVAARVTGLPPGRQIAGQLVVSSSGASCGPALGSVSFELLTPTNRFTGVPVTFGIVRPLGVFADFDGDGVLDFVAQPLASPSQGLVTEVGGLGKTLLAQPGFQRWNVVVLDFDGDGRPDIVQSERNRTNENANVLVAYRNEPGGALALQALSWPGLGSGRLIPIDVDHDGYEDLLIIGRTNALPGPPAVWWQRSLGNGRFEPTNIVPFPVSSPSLVQTVDFDGDGWTDLLVGETNSLSGATRVYRNRHDNGFKAHDGAWGEMQVHSAAWADFTGDGRLDLVLAGTVPGSGPAVRIYSEHGAAGFVEVGDGFPRNEAAIVGAGDLDADGLADLVVLSETPRIYFNTGNAHFRAAGEPLPLTPSQPYALGYARCQVVDTDGDGDPDVLWMPDGWVVETARNEGAEAGRPRLRASVESSAPGSIRRRILVDGGRGRAYGVEASDDLRSWQSAGRVLNAGGGAEIPTAMEPGRPRRFFRATTLPSSP